GGIGGARAVRVSTLTRNVLVEFDERVTSADRVLEGLGRSAAGLVRDNRASRSGRGARSRIEPAPRRSRRSRPALHRPRDAPASVELLERAARTVGAASGLGVVAVRRGQDPLPPSPGPSLIPPAHPPPPASSHL